MDPDPSRRLRAPDPVFDLTPTTRTARLRRTTLA